MLQIDGSIGEGGGQILRSSISLSAVTGTPVEVFNVRAGRRKPGLLKQHLCAVQALAEVCHGTVDGAVLGSDRVVFRPQSIRAGRYRFSVGSAGSASLVLQTVLPALLMADEASTVTIEGGTHNPAAPPFEFIDEAFCPVLQAMGARVDLRLERAGFYPSGGGRIVVEVTPPAGGLGPWSALERGALMSTQASIVSSGVPAHVARRERDVLLKRFGQDLVIRATAYECYGPGNVVVVSMRFASAASVFVGFGARGKRAEAVAKEAADQAQSFVAARVPVDVHLADQLLLPLALGAGGEFETSGLTPHAQTNTEVIQRFLPVSIRTSPAPRGRAATRVSVRPTVEV
ncbi:MAG: RNA 3'-terminal phosphate cyclase [Myxococcota bacterium]